MGNFNDFYLKQRTGKECTKMDCDRHENYVARQYGTSDLEFCMNCKHAHISQYKRKVPNAALRGRASATCEGPLEGTTMPRKG